MGEWLDALLGRPIYRIAFYVVAVELALISLQSLWLLYHVFRDRWHTDDMERFRAELDEAFMDALDHDDSREHWIQKARRYPKRVSREYLMTFLLGLRDEYFEKVRLIYEQLGLLDDDLRLLRKGIRLERIVALRRLYLVATPAEREAIMAAVRGDQQILRVLAVLVLGRVGTAEDLFELMRGIRLASPMMAQPIFTALQPLSREALAWLMSRWGEISDPHVRKALVITATKAQPERAERWVHMASIDPDVAVRSGACEAAKLLSVFKSLAILLTLLEDTDADVRAEAAWALSEWPSHVVLDPLTKALSDRSYWVRQRAAQALSKAGDAGLQRLREIVGQSDDPFASDAARQELERFELVQRSDQELTA